jgi:DNA primase
MNVLSSAAIFYNKSLFSPQGKKYLKYLTEKRGLQPEVLKKYLIGCSTNYFDLYNYLRTEGFNHDSIYKSGLIKPNKKDLFYKYITFPVIEENKVVYLTARHHQDSDKIKHKHLNGEIASLFNIDLVSGSSIIILTEAIIDSLTLLQNGFPAVSCLGANSFKVRHIRPFLETHKVYILFDNDVEYNKGFKSALETAWMLHTRRGINARIVRLPIDGDVNELWLQSKGNFKDKITESLYYAKDYMSTFHFQKKSLDKEKKGKKRTKSKTILPNLQAVRSIPIIEVVGDQVDIEEIGNNMWKGLCPFHEDKETRSLTLYKDSNEYHCYGCNAHGDSVKFVMETQEFSFGETIRYLYDKYVK